MFPSFTSIIRFINPISIRGHYASRCVFSHAYIYDVWVTFRNGNCPNRTSFKITIRNIFPKLTAILCFPEPSASVSHIVRHRISNNTRCRDRSTTSKRTNISVFDSFKNRIYGLCESCCSNKE